MPTNRRLQIPLPIRITAEDEVELGDIKRHLDRALKRVFIMSKPSAKTWEDEKNNESGLYFEAFLDALEQP